MVTEQAQASASLCIHRCETLDAARVEYDDQRAARVRDSVLAGFGRARTEPAESSHACARALAVADGAPCAASSSSSQASSEAMRCRRSSSSATARCASAETFSLA